MGRWFNKQRPLWLLWTDPVKCSAWSYSHFRFNCNITGPQLGQLQWCWPNGPYGRVQALLDYCKNFNHQVVKKAIPNICDHFLNYGSDTCDLSSSQVFHMFEHLAITAMCCIQPPNGKESNMLRYSPISDNIHFQSKYMWFWFQPTNTPYVWACLAVTNCSATGWWLRKQLPRTWLSLSHLLCSNMVASRLRQVRLLLMCLSFILEVLLS